MGRQLIHSSELLVEKTCFSLVGAPTLAKAWIINYILACAVNKYWINQGAPNIDFWAHEVSRCRTLNVNFVSSF